MQGLASPPRPRLPRASAWRLTAPSHFLGPDRTPRAMKDSSPATTQMPSSFEYEASPSATAPLGDDDAGSSSDPSQSRRATLIAGGVAAAALASSPRASQAVVSIPDPDSLTRHFSSRDFERGAGTAKTVEAFEFVVPLRVVAPRGVVPADWASDFRSLLGKRGTLAFEARAQVSDIVKELSSPERGREEEEGGGGGGSGSGSERKRRSAAGKGAPRRTSRHESAATADAVCLSDQWLGPAVARGLIRPIPGAEEQRWWRDLPPRWRSLCFRDASTGRRVPLGDPIGAIFAAPFRWGCTVVAFRGAKLASGGESGDETLSDWGDLLRPELRGRVAFSDSPRDLLTAALGLLGLPPSPQPGTEVDARALRGAVQALRRQALTFDGRDHARALAAGDALAAVGSSSDLVPLALRSGAVSLMTPASGTALWADLWCVPAFAGSPSPKGARGGRGGEGASSPPPASSGPSPLLPAWFELALTESRAEPGRGLRGGGGASPLLLPPTLEEQLLAQEEEEGEGRSRRGRWWQVWRREPPGSPAPSRSHRRRSSLPPPVPSDRAERARAALIVGGSLPSREVLSRSDFCVPAADERIERAFREALRP